MDLYAHTPNDTGEWHRLECHLRRVSELAAEFAGSFGAADLGRWVGLLHDVGKASQAFQDYLRAAYRAKQEERPVRASSVEHKVAGAKLATELAGLLAIPILGHHGGLPDTPTLKSRLAEAVSRDAVQAIDRTGEIVGVLDGRSVPLPEFARDALSCELLVRMLFSALVDADFLDAEEHWERKKAGARGAAYDLAALWRTFEENQSALQRSVPETAVNRARREVYEACAAAAEGAQGVYRLTVPTGGGKTRSGMAFALKHAVRHRLDRVIVAIPYTSIIDQNAEEYRKIFGARYVLEHHSAVEFEDGDEYSEDGLRLQLAAENWDAPIIVTTTVQLFDSIFSNRPSRCRKLHNIARSVIVLDEAQTLPVGLLAPIIDVLKQLVKHYGVTLVLSTATQPAFSGESPYLKGFVPEPVEIVPEPSRYFRLLERVHYEVSRDPWSWEGAAAEMRRCNQALCVVNSRKDALTLFDLLGDPDALHLSTLMCPAHRKDVIAEIKRRLAQGAPCRLVSTQVVEAGVDMDFPVVFRAMGPLDRIVQAAGRCNREGSLADGGKVVVFEPQEGAFPRGPYAAAMAEARIMLTSGGCDLHSPETYDQYFHRLWQDCDLDSARVQPCRERLDYPKVADRFRMIRDQTVGVVVHYGDPGPAQLLSRIRLQKSIFRQDWRRLQPYTASLFQHELEEHLRGGDAEQIVEGIYVWVGPYDKAKGLSRGLADPADLIT